MSEIRLRWEPQNKTPLGDIEARLRGYMKGKGGVSLLENGTLLFTPEGGDNERDARRAMAEARFLIDFQVTALKEGGFLVAFHHALAVFVGEEEFLSVRSEVQCRLGDLQFPGEVFFHPEDVPADHILVGLYARGKLQRDAYHVKLHCRIVGSPTG